MALPSAPAVPLRAPCPTPFYNPWVVAVAFLPLFPVSVSVARATFSTHRPSLPRVSRIGRQASSVGGCIASLTIIQHLPCLVRISPCVGTIWWAAAGLESLIEYSSLPPWMLRCCCSLQDMRVTLAFFSTVCCPRFSPVHWIVDVVVAVIVRRGRLPVCTVLSFFVFGFCPFFSRPFSSMLTALDLVSFASRRLLAYLAPS